MKKTHFIFIALIFLPVIFSGCGEDTESVCADQPDVSSSAANVNIIELQNNLPDVKNREELIYFLNNNPVVAEIFLKRSQYPNDSVMISLLLERFTNPYIDTLKQEVDEVFGDLSVLTNELEDAYSHLKYYYPEFGVPTVKTVLTGLDNDLYMSDSLVVIGLDYFLGEGARFRPGGLYEYMLVRYTPEKIVPSLVLLYGISPSWNKTDLQNKTMLAEMVTYGKAYYFAKQMMPCTPDSVFLSYTAEEMDGVKTNGGTIWGHFLEEQLLFETNHITKQKYLEERPKTYEIGEKAPGRIGTWVGWEIVRAYMRENPETSLRELMEITDPQLILDGGHYSPKNK